MPTVDSRRTIALAGVGRVYDAEREQAIRQQYDAEYGVRLGVIASRRIMFRSVAAIMRAWQEGRAWQGMLSSAYDRVAVLARDSMVYGVLKGRERSVKEMHRHPRSAPKLDRQQRKLAVAASTPMEWDEDTLRLETMSPVFHRAIAVLRKRSILTQKELAELEESADKHLVRVMATAKSDAQRELMQAMTKITEQGMHVRDGVDALRETFDKLGISSNKPHQLEAIFRTQTQLAYSAGQQQVFAQEAIQEILWGYKYVTAGDDRVREEHALMDGVCLPKEHPFWRSNTPPNGWNCRCQVIAKFDEMKVVKPIESKEVDGKTYFPMADKGFRFNPVNLFPPPATSRIIQ